MHSISFCLLVEQIVYCIFLQNFDDASPCKLSSCRSTCLLHFIPIVQQDARLLGFHLNRLSSCQWGCFIFLLSSHCRPSSWRCSKLQKKTQKQNHRLRDIIYRHCTNLRKGYVKVTLWDTTFKYPFSSTKERGDYNEGVYKQRGKYRHYKELIEQIPWDFSFHKWSYERKRQDEQFFEDYKDAVRCTWWD